MLPRPRLFALVSFEGVERDDQHSLGAFGPEPRVHVVEPAGRRRHAQRCRDPARQPVEIIVWPERLGAHWIHRPAPRCADRSTSRSDACVSEWPPKRPRASTIKFTSREGAVRRLEFIDGGLGQRDQRTFGNPGVAFGDLQRVAPPVDQLDSKREPPLVDQPSHTVERHVVGLTAHRVAKELGEGGSRPAAFRSSRRRRVLRTARAAG